MILKPDVDENVYLHDKFNPKFPLYLIIHIINSSSKFDSLDKLNNRSIALKLNNIQN